MPYRVASHGRGDAHQRHVVGAASYSTGARYHMYTMAGNPVACAARWPA